MAKLTYQAIDDNGNEIVTVNKAKTGKAPHFQILKYHCKLGNSDFIIHGHKPSCAYCASKKMVSCVEVSQDDLFQKTHFDLVAQCKKCGKHTVYRYILESRE